MANLCELFDNIVQMQALNGVPLANGKLYVYALGRTRLMDTWSDVDGESLNSNPIILDDAGQAHCFVSDDFDYTLVVCDAYNNEVFSIDKYLYSKGEHSHADVAVAPSEHIAVSSYHVGETTVYVPYIVGELGKTYHGIEPIVVNNVENKISARNIPLGVQAPLHFVEDSESACIIGFSGDMSGMATKNWVEEQEYMQAEKLEFNENGQVTGFDGSAFAAGYVDPSDFIPWSASGNFATSGDLNDKLDTTAFSTVSGDFLTAIPDTYASKDFVSSSVSSKLDSTAFSTVSGDFITALPEGLLNESGFEYDGDKISAYNGSAFVGQGGGELSGYELSAGNGISIDNYPIEQKTVISVTGNYATEDWVTGQGYLTAETDWTNTITAASANAYNEATAAIPTGLATTGDLQTVSGEITAMIPSTAGLATENWVTGQGYITNDAITGKQDITGMTAYQAAGDYYSATNPSGFITGVDLTPYQLTADMTAYQPSGDYLTTADSGEFYTTANESGFITGVDLTPYQTTAGMTAYQSAGDYLTTGDSANFYTTANESGFITGVDLAPYQTTAGMTAYQTTADMSNYATTGDLSYVSGVVGDVESLLASL